MQFGFQPTLVQTVVMFTQFYDPGLQPGTGFGDCYADSIYSIGAATVGFALLMLLRPILLRQPARADKRAWVQAIVEQHGRLSLAYLVPLDDKSS